MFKRKEVLLRSSVVFSAVAALTIAATAAAQTDPGPRPLPVNAGGPFPALSPTERAFFSSAKERFKEVDSVSGAVAGEAGVGLGPTFNTNSCAACHAQPDVGDTSPHPTLGIGTGQANNPDVAMASLDRLPGRNQTVPSFVTATGPVREARFIINPDGSLDGGVHGLYTIAGRVDAGSCNLAQPNFAQQLQNGNVIFRIPTPVFGLGLIENVPDLALQANLANGASTKQSLGIFGRFNTTGNDGTITRFGWKAQNKSLLIFAGEAYNVEQGVSNEVFPNERSAVSDSRRLHQPHRVRNASLTGQRVFIRHRELRRLHATVRSTYSQSPGLRLQHLTGPRIVPLRNGREQLRNRMRPVPHPNLAHRGVSIHRDGKHRLQPVHGCRAPSHELRARGLHQPRRCGFR